MNIGKRKSWYGSYIVLQFFRVKINIPYFRGYGLAGIWVLLFWTIFFYKQIPCQLFRKARKYWKWREPGHWKAKDMFPKWIKNARPGKLLTGAGRTMKFDYDGELSFLIFFTICSWSFSVPGSLCHQSLKWGFFSFHVSRETLKSRCWPIWVSPSIRMEIQE